MIGLWAFLDRLKDCDRQFRTRTHVTIDEYVDTSYGLSLEGNVDDEVAMTVLGTMVKYSLEEPQLCGSLSLQRRTACLNIDQLCG